MVHRPALNPLSYTSQGWTLAFVFAPLKTRLNLFHGDMDRDGTSGNQERKPLNFTSSIIFTIKPDPTMWGSENYFSSRYCKNLFSTNNMANLFFNGNNSPKSADPAVFYRTHPQPHYLWYNPMQFQVQITIIIIDGTCIITSVFMIPFISYSYTSLS